MDVNQLNWNIGKEQPNKEQLEAAKQKEYELDVHFLKTFNTPSGKIVLDWLVLHTLDTPTWFPNADIAKATANGFFREGQNGLVRQIKAKIKNAKDYMEKRK